MHGLMIVGQVVGYQANTLDRLVSPLLRFLNLLALLGNDL